MIRYIEAMQLEPHYRKEAAEDEHGKISKIHILLHTVIPSLSRFVILDLRCMASLQTARVALAIERYRQATGNLPDALGPLCQNR